MSLLLLPEKKICYLLPLEKDLSTPRKLLSDLDKAEVRTCKLFSTNRFLRTLFCIKTNGLKKQPPQSLTIKGCVNVIRRFWCCLCSILQRANKKISEIRSIEHKWTASSELTDRSVLSDELANFCAKYPIYYVKEIEDTLTTTRIQTGGEGHFKSVKTLYNPNLTLRPFQSAVTELTPYALNKNQKPDQTILILVWSCACVQVW